MAWADEIAELNTKIDQIQKKIDWVEGNSNTFTVGSADENVTYTCNGRDGFYAQWRIDNSSATSGVLFELWDEWNGGDFSGDVTIIAGLTTQKNELISDRDDLQSKIDGGTAVDAGA